MFQVNWAPHIRDKATTTGLMWQVLVALVPALIAAVYFFGKPALVVIVSTSVAAVATEAVILLLRKKKLQTLLDGSALLTGLLLAMNLPPSLPWWVPAIGAFVAIAFAKHAFGGLGMNIFNPALIGRAFLLASYPVMMTFWSQPITAVTTATPLGMAKEVGLSHAMQAFSYWQSFVGMIPGSLGETSKVALLIGAAFLLLRRVIDWKIPFSYLFTVAVFAFLAGQDIGFHLLSGGLILGAFFMATDYVTSPVTPWGRIIFGAGAGILTMVIRLWGGYPEGVCYAILIMNMLVPFLDKVRFQKAMYLK